MPRLSRLKTFRDKEDHREDWSEDFNDIEQRVDAVRRVSSDLYKKMSSLSATEDDKRLKKAPVWPVKQEFENAEKCITSDALLQSVFIQLRIVLDEVSCQYRDHLHHVDNAVLIPLKDLEDECKRLLKDRKNLTQLYADLKYRRDQLPTEHQPNTTPTSSSVSQTGTTTSTSGSQQSNSHSPISNATGTNVANCQLVGANVVSNPPTSSSTTDGPTQKWKEMAAQLEDLTMTANSARDNYLKDLYTFAASDRERSRIFVKYMELHREYHQQCYTKLTEQMEELDKVIKLRSMKTVFGVDLKTHLKETNRTIAYVLQVCIEALLKRRSIREQGIFRVSPGMSRAGHLLARLNIMPLNAHFLSEFDAITIANAIKNYVGKLPETLLGDTDPHAWKAAGEMNEHDGSRVEALREAVKHMDAEHCANLAYLCQFLHRVTQFSSFNNMDAYNLSVVFAPNFFQGSSGMIGPWQLGVTKCLIEHCAQIFPQSDYWLEKFDLEDKVSTAPSSSVTTSHDHLSILTIDNESSIINLPLSPMSSKFTKSADDLNESREPPASQKFSILKDQSSKPVANMELSRHVRNLSLSTELSNLPDSGTDTSSSSKLLPLNRPPLSQPSVRRNPTKKAPPPPPSSSAVVMVPQAPAEPSVLPPSPIISTVAKQVQSPVVPSFLPPPPSSSAAVVDPQTPAEPSVLPPSPMIPKVAKQVQYPVVPSFLPPPPPPPSSSAAVVAPQTPAEPSVLPPSPVIPTVAKQVQTPAAPSFLPPPPPNSPPSVTQVKISESPAESSPPLRVIAKAASEENAQPSTPTPIPRRTVQSIVIADAALLSHPTPEHSTNTEKGYKSSHFLRNASLRIPRSSHLISDSLKKLGHFPHNSPQSNPTNTASNNSTSPFKTQHRVTSGAIPESSPIPAFGRPKPGKSSDAKLNATLSLKTETDDSTTL